ncbi:MAG: NYN domain-containing protein [Anaerolineae bacterium]
MPYLIDGHNVIAAMPDIALEDPDDEAMLVMRLRAWAARIRRRAIVVFDGGIPGGPSRVLSSSDVRVVFAARHHTNADRIIRERLRALPDASNWTVVSSDHEILDEARSLGARVMTAQAFADEMDRPPVEKEKPDTVSPAEVEAWLEIFQEPEEESAPTPTPPSRPRRGAAGKRGTRRKKHHPRRSEASHRETRTIGDQLGVEVPPEPEPSEKLGKPSGATREEVAAWLEVFQDDPESHVPPPNLPERPKQPSSPSKPAVVRKDGDLSAGEVEAWLDVFQKGGRTPPSSRQAPSSESSTPGPKQKKRRRSGTLARHQDKFAPAEGEEKAELSDEDLELWHRLFGEE